MWPGPPVEVVVVKMLIAGLSRSIASLVAIFMTILATYVHLIVQNRSILPLHHEALIIPLAPIFLCLYVFAQAVPHGPLICDGRIGGHLIG